MSSLLLVLLGVFVGVFGYRLYSHTRKNVGVIEVMRDNGEVMDSYIRIDDPHDLLDDLKGKAVVLLIKNYSLPNAE